MNEQKLRDALSDEQLGAHLKLLRNSPAPDLARGRARVLAAASKQRQAATDLPRYNSFALALGVTVAVCLTIVMNSALGASNVMSVAMTRTQTVSPETSSPIEIPANAFTPSHESAGLNHVLTPTPGLIPEPPSPTFSLTGTYSSSASN